jgi:probable O-glycosylation ligase (exosortase A-associated)
MRDLLVTAIVVGSLPVCFVRPWIGVLVWSWIGYMNPHRLCWGFARDMPFAEMVAIATLAGYPLCKDRYPLPRRAEVFLLIALWVVFVLSTLFAAIDPARAWLQLDKVSKIFLMTFVTLLLFQDERKLRVLIWVIAFSIGFYGFKGGMFALLTGGNYQVLGPDGSFIAGNTDIGLAMDMVLPLLILLRRDTDRRWLRQLLLIMSLCTIAAILSTYSRGAFLGLVAVLGLLLLQSRVHPIAVVVVGVAGLLAVTLMPVKWFARVETIETYRQDQSANARLNSWYVSYHLALDHPVLGAGFRPFSPEIYAHYIPGYVDTGHDAHSIFFQVLAEHGFTGLLLYVALIVTLLTGLWRTRRAARRLGAARIANYAGMLEVSLGAYLVCGTFLSMSYFDLFYHLVAVAVILKMLLAAATVEDVRLTNGRAAQPADRLAAALWGTGTAGAAAVADGLRPAARTTLPELR